MGATTFEIPWQSALKDVQDRAMDFAKDNAELAFSFAGKICNAQNPQELMQLQRLNSLKTGCRLASLHTQELYSLMG